MNGATCQKRSYGAEGGFHATTIFGVQNTEVEPYMCRCPQGYGGLYCEVAFETCDMNNYINPCSNGGFCTTNTGNSDKALNGVECKCKCGFWGRRCEFSGGWNSVQKGVTPNILDFCTNEGICQNDAECINAFNRQGAFCICKAGWTGIYCDQKTRSAAAGVAPSVAIIALVAAVAAALKF